MLFIWRIYEIKPGSMTMTITITIRRQIIENSITATGQQKNNVVLSANVEKWQR